MKAAVLSDTHNLLRPEVKEIIRDCDGVIHAGDICSEKVLDEIKAIMKPEAQLFCVRGNCDGAWAEKLPLTLGFSLSDVSFFLVHNKRDIPEDVKADIIVFGHSHKFNMEKKENTLYLNPGSCGGKRFKLPVTMTEIKISSGKYEVKKIEIKNEASVTDVPEDLIKNIRLIMKYTKRGDSIETISKRLKVGSAFTEQIVRIILTHPYVDEKGIAGRYYSIKGSEEK